MINKQTRKDPEYWDTTVRNSEQFRKRFAKKYEWSKIKKIWNTGALHTTVEVEGAQQSVDPGFSGTFVNWVWSFCQTFIPAVYWRQPQVRVVPKKPQDGAMAPLVQAIINGQISRSRFRRECTRSLCDALIYGHGWTKMGWFGKTGQVPDNKMQPEQKRLEKMGKIDRDFNMSLGEGYMVRVSPENMFIDHYASSYEQMRWVCQQYYRRYDDVKADPFFKNTDNLAPVDLLAEGEGEDNVGMPLVTDVDRASGEEGWIRVWEIWDRIDRKVRFLCSGSEKWNRVVPWPYPEVHGFPFKPLTFTEGINQFYPVSVILPWLPLVEELSTLRTLRLKHMNKMNPKALLPPNLLDEDKLEAFSEADCDFMVATGDPNQSPPFIFPGMRPDAILYQAEDGVKQDIRDISGFSELLSGSVPYSRIAATTSAIMEQNSKVRFTFYSERLADHIIDCARDMFVIARQMMEYPQLVEITGKAGPKMLPVSKEALHGDYMFHIDLEDLSAMNRQQRMKEAYDALSTLAQFSGQNGPVKLEPLLRDFLTSYGKSDSREYLNPPQGPPLDPNYENDMLAKGIPVRPNPLEDFQLHLQIHNQFMRGPQWQQIQQVPQIVALFSEHIQETNGMAQQQMAQQGAQGRAGGGQSQAAQQVMPSASQQQGQAQVASQPFGGQQGLG